MKTTDNHYSISNFNDIIPDEEFETIKNKNIFILVRMNGCIFCDLMKKEWFDTIKKKQRDNDLIFIDIERTMLNYFVNKDKMFNDLNSIFIIYHENASPSLTKKIKLKPTSNKKTKHKRYKEIKK